jgi:SET domain-containing protein
MTGQDNPKLVRKETELYGGGVFATADIKKDEVIALWNGPVYEAENNSDLPNDPPLMVADHAIQFEKHKWRDSEGLARYINHSCDPNCGIKGLFNARTQ